MRPALLTVRPLTSAVRAVERSLTIFGVGILRDAARPPHRLEYELDGEPVAVVGYTDELAFVRHPDPQVVALVRAHHALATTT